MVEIMAPTLTSARCWSRISKAAPAAAVTKMKRRSRDSVARMTKST
jgi:hypothetical protein